MGLRFRPDLKPRNKRFLPGALNNQAKSKKKRGEGSCGGVLSLCRNVTLKFQVNPLAWALSARLPQKSGHLATRSSAYISASSRLRCQQSQSIYSAYHVVVDFEQLHSSHCNAVGRRLRKINSITTSFFFTPLDVRGKLESGFL